MVAKITFYKNILPNQGNHTYYYFKTLDAYVNFLSADAFPSYDVNNYRFNGLSVRITIDKNIHEGNYKNVTYMFYNDVAHQEFYFITNAIVQSNCIIFTLQLDMWATYLLQASISRLNILKCNRNIAVGLYDDIAGTNDEVYQNVFIDGVTSGDDNQYFDINKCSIVFCMNYNWKEKIASSVTQTECFAIDLYTLKKLLIDSGADDANKLTNSYYNAVDIAIGVVSGIYGVEATGFTANEAHVISAWLVDNRNILTTDGLITIKSTSEFFQDLSFTPKKVLPFRSSQNYNLSKLNVDKKYFFGTKSQKMEVIRTTEPVINIKIEWTTKTDGLSCIIKQGGNQLDITNSLVVNLSTNNGDVIGMRTLVSTLAGVANAGIRVAGMNYTDAGINSGQGFLGISSAAIGVGSMLKPSGLRGSQIGSGDGASCFRDVRSSALSKVPYENIVPIKNPYEWGIQSSMDNEKAKAAFSGANYYEFLDSIEKVFTYDFLIPNLTDLTFIVANALVEKIPQEAKDYFVQALRNGIYIKNL